MLRADRHLDGEAARRGWGALKTNGEGSMGVGSRCFTTPLPGAPPRRSGEGGLIDAGVGNDNGRPPMIGLGHPPAVLSKPFRLKMTFMLPRALCAVSVFSFEMRQIRAPRIFHGSQNASIRPASNPASPHTGSPFQARLGGQTV